MNIIGFSRSEKNEDFLIKSMDVRGHISILFWKPCIDVILFVVLELHLHHHSDDNFEVHTFLIKTLGFNLPNVQFL
jgi:hypothetical protein